MKASVSTTKSTLIEPIRAAHAHKVTAEAILSQSAVRQSANGVRLISQFQWRQGGQPARVIPHVDCHAITILCLLWTLYSWRSV